VGPTDDGGVVERLGRRFETAAAALQHRHALALALEQHGQQQGHRAAADDDDVLRGLRWRGVVQVDDHAATPVAGGA
jgi:hypothetical protein